MAANWIKVEVITPDKPEIYLIAERLNIDPDTVLGKLIRLWVWADQQIAICNAESVTNETQKADNCNATVLNKIAIDRVAFMSGFADALISVGWLAWDGERLYFKNFEKHNGKNSKNRALTNERVNKVREMKRKSNAKCNANSNAGSVTQSDQKPLPEEEEDIKELKDPPLPPRGKRDANKFNPLESELPDWLNPVLWEEWVNFRRQLKKPIKTQQGVTESLNRLDEFRQQGFSPEQVIRQSIANEWQGLFQPRNQVGRNGAGINPAGNYNGIPEGFTG